MTAGHTPTSYTAEVPVRWSDMDVFQHVNHARMVTLLEESRIDWLRGVDPEVAAAMFQNSVVAHLDVRYRTPLTHHDSPLSVTMWLERVRTVDLTIRYEVRAAGAGRRLSGPRSWPPPSSRSATRTPRACAGSPPRSASSWHRGCTRPAADR